VSNQMKLEFFQIRHQLCFLEIVAHNFRARSERSLYPRRNRKTFLDSLLSKQTSSNQNRRIRGISTGSNCSDDHGPVFQSRLYVLRNMFVNVGILDANGSRIPTLTLPAL